MTRQILMAALVAMTSVGCVGAPPSEGELTSALATAFANDKPAYDFFVGKGLTNFQAAGIVGNLDQESGVDPGSVQYGGGPGRGIAQWSVGGRWDTSANDNVLAYAKSRGAASGSLNLQLEFIWYELTTFGYGLSTLKASTNVTDATIAFMDKYEICGTCASSQRISYAQAVLKAYGAAPPYAATYVSQSWPVASKPPLTIKCGQSVAAKITMHNAGSKAWDSSTRFGTTMQRDRASIFAGSDWVSPSRAAAINGTVAPGADGSFTFSFHGPTGAACVPGSYHEFFGIVQEGVAWFSDNGQGGPPDNQIEALIDLVPADATGGGVDMGGGGGGATDDGGATQTGGDNGGSSGTGGNGSDGTGAPGTTPHAGCSISGTPSSDGLVLVAVFAFLILRRRDVRRAMIPSGAWRAKSKA